MADASHPCPHCDRAFGDPNGLYCHVKTKHGRKKAQAVRPAPTVEPSMADLHVAALEARACGEPVDPDLAEMFDV
ncbi:conserved protein of unknown function [Methylorubrum extorquens]|uniref:C2H2-type domain-containing protein n=1 Tax=Methylorubrum extorquens TaxID=408 RepID=A0A2N9AIQ1_METEX|nr:conserved protein of unknown function [Methylorubrum extorquens]